MSRLSTSEARRGFADVVSRAAFGKERVILTRQGRDLVAVVPVEDLALIEKAEDQADNELADRALAEAESRGETPIDWHEAKRILASK